MNLDKAAAVIEVASELGEIEAIKNFLKKNLQALPVTDEEHFQIELALIEICLNIIHYAYPENRGTIQVKFWTEGPQVFLEIRDKGVPFDPSQSPTPDIEDLIRKRKKGGLGIYLSRELMDGFAYRRDGDQNILLMHKKLSGAGEN
ncbi:MAG: ATP-binding protein [Candidatus Saccharicenans sp.]|jgi:anti-sigma regulatory factor (Ser/Thr protein kinase)|nr:ATP-binding protein [Candidatus Saccharicenans sp.]MDH7575502.1 ATP-binding protein [Candidatus Saccharicenans sp.]